jgi:hypothetical protein
MNAPRFSRRYWFNLIGFSLIMIVVGYFAYVRRNMKKPRFGFSTRGCWVK